VGATADKAACLWPQGMYQNSREDWEKKLGLGGKTAGGLSDEEKKESAGFVTPKRREKGGGEDVHTPEPLKGRVRGEGKDGGPKDQNR